MMLMTYVIDALITYLVNLLEFSINNPPNTH